ncbi:MAG: recombinase family protein [Lachnospirales bacterium]
MNIGIYLRVSVEDENKDNESDSITNQREYIYNYIKSNKLEYDEIFEYIDDGKSATNFNREGITNLLTDTNNGKINCIIVKDLSRFGRNYIETTEYIENIFTLLNVRFIAINDNYDSSNKDDFNNYFNLNFKNIIYGYYSKDISKKVKTAWLNKARIGKIPTSSAPYGYTISKENKHKFEIDKNTYKIVQDIFNMACEGKNFTEIAKILNDKNILTPLEYKMSIGKVNKLGKCKGKLFWKSLTARNILKNEVYTGTRIYGKTEIKEIGTRNYKNINKENWVVFENHHQAIISKETFEKAQCIFKGNRKSRQNKENIFKGVLKCGYCGYDLQKINNSCIKYTCNTLRYTDEFGCKYFIIKEEDIKEFILNEVSKKIDVDKFSKRFEESDNRNIDDELKQIKVFKENLYNSYLKEEISKEMYLQEKEKLNRREEELESKNDGIVDYGMVKEDKSLKAVVDNFIEEIKVFEGERIEVCFKDY